MRRNRKEYVRLKETARAVIHERLFYFNQVYGFKVGRVSIKNHKSRWGSCSGKGNLNFNYKIIKLPPRLADYIIVHELCHLGEFNHSLRFWALVGKTVPEHRTLRRVLRALERSRSNGLTKMPF